MIEVKNLSKKYDSRGIAGLHSVNLKINEGEIFSLMGPNGSGKTTFLKLLIGAVSQDSGEILLKGKASFFPREESFPLGNVQNYLVKSVTLNINDEKKIQLARDLADTFEFTFQLRQNFSELSSGQKQKVLLARELINLPSILLLDEPFAHLDPFTRKDILSSLFSFIKSKKMTILWVSHDLEEVLKFSDRIGILNFGKIEQIDSPEKIVPSPGNLFVARFIGYHNFFPVQYENYSWQTPWGQIERPEPEFNQGLMIVPDSSWREDGELPFKVVQRFAGIQCVQYVIEHKGKTYFYKKYPHEKILHEGDEIYLSVDHKSVLFIQL